MHSTSVINPSQLFLSTLLNLLIESSKKYDAGPETTHEEKIRVPPGVKVSSPITTLSYKCRF